MNPEISGNSKNKAYLIITSAFAIGVITGMLCMNLVTAKTAATNPRKPTPLEELSRELQLDQVQEEQVEKAYQEFHQRNKELLTPIQPQLTELRLQTRAKIRSLLRPEQQTRFDELKKARDAEREKEAAGRK
jgi:uncharacterized membrane-anchored protein YhcB (DUF1043 family)